MRTDTATARASAAVRSALEAELHDARQRGNEQPRVLDVGGGTGVWAVPLASAGCLVTVVEPNQNALATLARRAEEEGVSNRITMVADDADALGVHIPAGSADLVLAHGVLEVVDDPASLVGALADAVAPGGAVSVLVANRYGAALQRALAGHLGEARQLLESADGVLREDGETLARRLDTDRLRALLTSAGLEVSAVHGDGVVSDAVPFGAGESLEGVTSWQDGLAEFELAASEKPPLRDIASRLHALARRPG